ncbi:hypothetical protein FMN52_19015 [Marinobacter sp. BW6]|uniref:hypothetical protein n=1 Tax=Marinobacter sp. BW6 TaxID=2592624 RepID=UPI0011DE5DB6|nr:hypothetical protein [Marinobacter sp. BW6]TYC53210.1 hypothetical protein FMN52_19015 [Marinobacter sp. BW6]
MTDIQNRWESKIERAVNEIEGRGASKRNSRSIELPPWFPYICFLVLGVFIANIYLSGSSYHEDSAPQEFQTGGKVALLMMAEDIEHFRKMNGRLPDAIPGALQNLMDVSYQKLSDDEFRLEVEHYRAKIRVGNGKELLEVEES